MQNRLPLLLAACVSALAFASSAFAQAPLLSGLGGPRGFGDECVHRNDDGSSNMIDLTEAFPAGLRFFDDTHTSVYVNTNGNLTFSGSLFTYTPNPFPVADEPMIAPYWADIDTRQAPGTTTCSTGTTGTCPSNAADGNAVWWHMEEGRMVVTWDEVGYFSCNNDLRMHFQLILTAVPSCGGGATDFDVEFRFNRCEWETGDASGGSSGFGGTEAQSGFDAGNGTDFVMLPGSREPGIAETLCTDSNLDPADPGVWRFQIRSGRVICPDAGEACNTGDPGVCGEGVIQCVGMGTECQPVVPSSEEVCDALDNDCDGMVDEGEGICGAGLAICDRGVCTDVCFEGSCPEGLECNEEGRCAEAACADVECPVGQRCSGGECVDSCAGITCPLGLNCVAGRCLDLCEDIECDPECSVCSLGECVPRCDDSADCSSGESCDDGLCTPTECVGVSCPAGTICQPGGAGCVDACEGAVCPTGESCEMGQCVSEMSGATEDMGPPPGLDVGPMDAGTMEPDMGRVVGRDDDGCGCATPGGSSRSPVLPLAFAALFGLTLLRRRR
jgi:MYXO-CTERM domain-containing protein